MIPPFPLDYQPPLILARAYRTTRKTPDFQAPPWLGGVFHTVESGYGPGTARSAATYCQNRTDGTSAHLFCDVAEVIQGVPDDYVSFCAGTPANDMWMQLEMCGRAANTDADWRTPGRLECIAWCTAHIAAHTGAPLKALYAEDLAADMWQKGFTFHYQITLASNMPGQFRDYITAHGNTKNNHTDPGPAFYPPYASRDQIAAYPLGRVFELAAGYLAPVTPVPPQPQPQPPSGDDMPTPCGFITVNAGTVGHHVDGSEWRATVNGTTLYVTPAGTLQWIHDPTELATKVSVLGAAGARADTWNTPVGDPDVFGRLEGDKPG
jgi:hypothetical protein